MRITSIVFCDHELKATTEKQADFITRVSSNQDEKQETSSVNSRGWTECR